MEERETVLAKRIPGLIYKFHVRGKLSSFMQPQWALYNTDRRKAKCMVGMEKTLILIH